ncbi:MAG: T9SS type A sorting domain-containing protein [Fimbriimonadaceae bacterium]|nr:T9SS type A sorting domain-containing protein [Chitinophagales bacterium]
MQSLKTYLLFLLLFYSALSIYAQDDVPNNTLLEAPEVFIPASFNATIGPAAGDVDYYKINIENPGVLEVSINNTTEINPPGIGLEVTCFADDGTSVVGYSPEGTIGYDNNKEFVVCPGVYFILINECYLTDNDKADADSFNVNIQLDTEEITECNNYFADAYEVPYDTSFIMKIYGYNELYGIYANDRDYFKVNIPVSGVFKLEMFNSTSLDIGIRLYSGDTIDAAKANSWVDFAPGYADMRTIVCPGIYYFFFNHDNGIENEYLDDSIIIKLSLDTSEIGECNNTFEDAIYVPYDTSFVTKLNGRNFIYGTTEDDIDYFMLVSKCDGQAEIGWYNETLTDGFTNVYNSWHFSFLDGIASPGSITHSFTGTEAGDTLYFSVELYSYPFSEDTFFITTEFHPYGSADIILDGDSDLCTGESLTLNADMEDAVYLWSTGDTTQSITVDSAGYYSLIVKDAACTYYSDTIHVEINAIPTAMITPGGPLEFCDGDTLILYASGGDTYDWIPGGTADSTIITYSGHYTLKAITEGCYGYDDVYVDVYDAPEPEIITDDETAFCEGGFATLYTAEAGDIIWNTGDTINFITVTTEGSYYLAITDTNGCYGISLPINIIIFPLPEPEIFTDDETAFCEGDSAILFTAGEDDILWSTGEITDSIFVNANGEYYYEVTDIHGCYNISSSVIITVFPLPVVPEISMAGDTLISTSALHYQWYFNGEIIDGATGSTYLPAETGFYSVVITDINGCVQTSEDLYFIFDGLYNVLSSGLTIKVYPNPAKNKLFIQSDLIITGVIIESITGKLIQSYSGNNIHEIDLLYLEGGFYVLKLLNGNEIKASTSFIKMN